MRSTVLSASILLIILPISSFAADKVVVIPLNSQTMLSCPPCPEPTGDAVESDVLVGKTFSNAAGLDKTGTMYNHGNKSYTPSKDAQSLLEGYYDGTGTVTGDANLAVENIRQGVSIFGIDGGYKGPTRTCGTEPDEFCDKLDNNIITPTHYFIDITCEFRMADCLTSYSAEVCGTRQDACIIVTNY